MSETEVEESTSLGELVKTYLTIRTERERIEAEWKAANDLLLADMRALEAKMLDTCNQNDAGSIRTNHGTVIRKLNERFTVSDGDSFRKFVLQTGAVDLFEARIHQGNFKEFIAENRDDGLPPGVNVMREFTVVVRKPSN